MSLRDSIIRVAVRIHESEGDREASGRVREELLAELDRLVLAARDPTHSLDEAILAILASDPRRTFSLDMIAGELSDLIYARVGARLDRMAEDGLVEKATDGRYRSLESRASGLGRAGTDDAR